MSGSTAVTQATPSYECQTRGSGTIRLDSLESIDPQGVADGAFAYIYDEDTLWRWYQGDATAPGASVIQPLINPTFGRWLLITSPVPPADHNQFITDEQLDAAIPLTRTHIALAQAPTLNFINLSASGDATVSHITAHNQQIVFEDGLTAATNVENQRARIRFLQVASIPATVGRMLWVADSPAADETVVSIYEPAYQQVQYALSTYHSANLKFVGTPVSVADNGTTTTVTISGAVASAPWGDVLGVGNTTDGHDAIVDGTDTLYLQDNSRFYVQDTALIQLDNSDNKIQWVAGGACTLEYTGAGAVPDAGYFQVSMLSTAGGNTSGILRIYEGSDVADGGGSVQIYSGAGSVTGSSGAIGLATQSGRTSGNISLVTGSSTTGNSGALRFITGAVTGVGDAGQILINAGSSTAGAAGAIDINSGLGVDDGGDITLRAANSRSDGNGGNIWCYTGSNPGGENDTGAGGEFAVETGASTADQPGSNGGPITLTTGASSFYNGGDISLTTGAGRGYGGSITLSTGAGTVSSGGLFTVATGVGPQGGAVAITTGGGITTTGGVFSIYTGDGQTAGGGVFIGTGDGLDFGGNGGNISIASGDGDDQGGNVFITTGAGLKTAGGILGLASGTGPAGGLIAISAGVGSQGNGGGITITTGASTTVGSGGTLSLITGSSAEANGGTFVVGAGTGALVGGQIIISAGKGTNTAGGGVSMSSGEGPVGGTFGVTGGKGTAGHGGNISLLSGVSDTTIGGNITLTTGAGATFSGVITLHSGDNPTAASGGVDIITGDALTSIGSINLIGGASTNGNGGNITINPGDGATSGGGLWVMAGDRTSGGGEVGGRLIVHGGAAGVVGHVAVSPSLNIMGVVSAPADIPASGGYLYSIGQSLYWKRSTSGSIYQLA